MSSDAPQEEAPAAAEAPHYVRKEAAFAGYLERDAYREKRRRGRRNTLVVSLIVHGLALGLLVVYSLWDVEELWAPPVPVKVFSRSALPPAVLQVPASPNATPDPLR